MPENAPDRTRPTPGDAADELIFSEDGVDLTLIRWMLSLTPTERLEALQDVIWSITRLRGEDAQD
jgi:hypothetical protein